jgi:DUF438 domain-containing protein
MTAEKTLATRKTGDKMEISAKTKIDDLLKSFPFLLDFFINKSPKFKHLKNPMMRKTIGKVATLKQVAEMGNLDLSALVAEIKATIQSAEGGADFLPTLESQAPITDPAERQAVLKGIIRDLHKGENLEALKKRFRELIKDLDPAEIPRMEQGLIDEGMPESEVKRLCDVHVAVFQESLDRHEMPRVPTGHPVHTLLEENRAAESLMNEIDQLLKIIETAAVKDTTAHYAARLGELIDSLSDINLHYLKKENQLFPQLEAHGLTAPPQVMWAIHDDIRAMLKRVKQLHADSSLPDTVAATREILTAIRDMIYKEDHVLLPLTLDTLSEPEWVKVKAGEAEIGYAWIQPQDWRPTVQPAEMPEYLEQVGKIRLDTGFLETNQINLILTHLPVDLTFVDENDEVAYYSQGKERIFARSPGIIGRSVQKCHPPKSVHIVNQILEKMKSGERDQADFWIQMGDRFIYIRYFAVRDASGNYKGCLEVSQDVSAIRRLEGERRLLQWQ